MMFCWNNVLTQCWNMFGHRGAGRVCDHRLVCPRPPVPMVPLPLSSNNMSNHRLCIWAWSSMVTQTTQSDLANQANIITSPKGKV